MADKTINLRGLKCPLPALRTRKALDWSHRFPEIAAEGRRLHDCMIDGEICALDDNGVPSFGGLQQALSDGRTGELIFFVFDLLFLEGVVGSADEQISGAQTGALGGRSLVDGRYVDRSLGQAEIRAQLRIGSAELDAHP